MKLNPIEPTEKQISNCARWNWEYLGDCIFIKGDLVGYFTNEGWVKE